jgi:hypothetical protein
MQLKPATDEQKQSLQWNWFLDWERNQGFKLLGIATPSDFPIKRICLIDPQAPIQSTDAPKDAILDVKFVNEEKEKKKSRAEVYHVPWRQVGQLKT